LISIEAKLSSSCYRALYSDHGARIPWRAMEIIVVDVAVAVTVLS